jgi:hypothetical protein
MTEEGRNAVAGTVGSAISLAYNENTFCTTQEQGWPLGIVIHPCLCWGMGQVDWFVSITGLVADTLIFGLGALVLIVGPWMHLARLRIARRAAVGLSPLRG